LCSWVREKEAEKERERERERETEIEREKVRALWVINTLWVPLPSLLSAKCRHDTSSGTRPLLHIVS
jgi:hypothetical protein